jgi:hypothetical protein
MAGDRCKWRCRALEPEEWITASRIYKLSDRGDPTGVGNNPSTIMSSYKNENLPAAGAKLKTERKKKKCPESR